jgi:signal transduction histidine kinase
MKTIVRLMFLFGAGLLLVTLIIGVLLTFIEELLLPGAAWERYNGDTLELSIIIAGMACYCLFFGWFVTKPSFMIQGWIQQLILGEYREPEALSSIYSSRTGKLKFFYQHYDGVIGHMKKFTEVLSVTEQQRKQIEWAKKSWQSGVSHDLKTPLSYILGYSAMLRSSQHEWTEEEQSQFLQEIQEKAEYMEALIRDLNESFELDHGDIPIMLVEHNIVELVRQTMAFTSSHPRAQGYPFEFHTAADIIRIHCDPKLLGRAFQNLLMNAVLHNPNPITIDVHISRHQDNVKIVVIDNGQGMDKETLANLFQRYYRGSSTDTPAEGTGLGMAIARQLIEAHGGTIEARSERERGTKLTILLPLKR